LEDGVFKKKNPDDSKGGQPPSFGNGEVKDRNPENEQQGQDEEPTPQQLMAMLPPLRLFKVFRTTTEPTIVEAHGVETNAAGGLEFGETVVLQALNGQYGFAKRYRRVIAGGTWTDVEEVTMPTTVPQTRGSSLIQH
jgi:hypothetical protein